MEFDLASFATGAGGTAVLGGIQAWWNRKNQLADRLHADGREDARLASTVAATKEQRQEDANRETGKIIREATADFLTATESLRLAMRHAPEREERQTLVREANRCHQTLSVVAPDEIEQLATDHYNATLSISSATIAGDEQWWRYLNTRKNLGASVRGLLHTIRPYPSFPKSLAEELVALRLVSAGGLVDPERGIADRVHESPNVDPGQEG